MNPQTSELIPRGEARCYVRLQPGDELLAGPEGEEFCPDNGERPCTCISPKGHPGNDPGGNHGCHCGRQWAVRRV